MVIHRQLQYEPVNIQRFCAQNGRGIIRSCNMICDSYSLKISKVFFKTKPEPLGTSNTRPSFEDEKMRDNVGIEGLEPPGCCKELLYETKPNNLGQKETGIVVCVCINALRKK